MNKKTALNKAIQSVKNKTKSKTKGKSYERDIANLLSEMYNESFTRVPHSGAFIGGQNFSRIEKLSENQTRGFKGDIIPPDNFPLLVIEAKNYGEFRWNHLALKNDVKQLDEWIGQAEYKQFFYTEASRFWQLNSAKVKEQSKKEIA